MSAEPWISLDQARDAISSGSGANVRVAILDSGVDTGHPDLENFQLLDDISIESRAGKIQAVKNSGKDVFGHGTAVASILRHHAPEVNIGSFRILGHFKESRAEIVRAGVREAALRGYQIIHCSFGAPARTQDAASYKGWLDALYLRGIHVVASGSNAGFHTPEWPAYFPTVISVGACPNDSEQLQLIPRSMIEFSISGREHSAAWLAGSRKEVFGSSFAAPKVTAMLARILSIFPDIHPLQAKALMRQLAARVCH